jgi:hypothetical protein
MQGTILKPEIRRNNIKNQFLLYRKHRSSIAKTNKLILFRQIISVYFENNIKPVNISCVKNAELLNLETSKMLCPVPEERLVLKQ